MSEFFPLVRPEVPDAQHNKSADILLEGMRTGLQAAAQFAQARRQSESEIMRIAAQERIAQDEHAVQREKIYKDTEVQDQLMKMHGQYYDSLGKAALMKADAYTKGLSNTVAFNQQRQDLVNDVNDHASSLKLDDPKFATEEPVKYAANVMQFEDMYQMSPLPEVKNAIKQYRTIADQQKIPMKTGVKDEDGTLKASGEGKMVPIWQVVKRMQDPLLQDQTMLDLEASGHTKIVNEFQDIGGTKVPVKRTEPTPLIKSYLEKGKGVDFGRVPSRVPAAMLPKSAGKGTAPTDLPAPDLPAVDETNPDQLPPDASAQPASSATPDYQPTETDKMIGMAKAALAKGAAPAAVTQKLQELGIDPAQLWAA